MYQQSFSLQLSITVICIAISLVILLLYYAKKISLVEALVYSFAAQTYSIPFIGPTITTFFLVTYALALEEFFFLLRRNVKIKKIFLLMFLLPLASILFTIGYYLISPKPYQYFAGSQFNFFFTPVFFYLKTFMPFFLIGNKLFRYFKTDGIDHLFLTIKNIIIFSCAIAAVQIVIDQYILNKDLKVLLGIKRLYQGYEGGSIRPQAFFIEPKHFSAFIGLSIPLLLKYKKYLLTLFAIAIGLLTRSQTFLIILLLYLVCFLIFKNLRNIRLKIFYSLIIIVGIFFLVSRFQQPILNYVTASEGSVLYNFVLDRAIERYRDNELDLDNSNQVLGMPLQKDLEFPVYKFFADQPVFLLFGYGPGFSEYLPPKYFEDVRYKYELQLKGGSPLHMNMRWFYYIAEMGVIIFLIFFVILTNVRFNNLFETRFFVFLWLIFFFNEIDYFLMLFFIYGFVIKLKFLEESTTKNLVEYNSQQTKTNDN